MIILLVVAALVVGAPLVAALLVSIASMREDAEHSLAGRAPGWLTGAARRLLRVNSAGPPRIEPPHVPRPRSPDADDATAARRLTGPQA